MTGESSDSSSPQQQPDTSVLITIRTPGEDAPICRLGNSEEILGDATVRQLIQRVINPNSLFAVGVPASQLQAESSAALAIGEMLSADCCEVRNGTGGEESGELVDLDKPVRSVAQEQVGSQGNRFLNVTLNVRSAADARAPESEERRELSLPEAAEVEQHDAESPAGAEQPVAFDLGVEPSEAPSEEPLGAPAATAIEDAKPEPMYAGPPPVQPGDASPLPVPEPVEAAPSAEAEPVGMAESAAPEPVAIAESAAPEPVGAALPASPEPAEVAESASPERAEVTESASPERVEVTASASPEPAEVAESASPEPAEVTESASPERAEVSGSASPEPAEAAVSAPSGEMNGIVAIVAEQVKEQPKPAAKPERTEYVRKADWLRAQFLPEVEALDFSGLFVGNLGLGIRQEQTGRKMVVSDPSRVTDILLRANGYRRSEEHAKALICYQELVDIDPGNADFRFLLAKTLLELGQREDALAAFTRAKELGHEGAGKELDQLNRSGNGNRRPLSFLRFWKQ